MGKLKNSLMWPNAVDHSHAINEILASEYFQHHSPSTYKPIRHKYNVIQTPEGDRVEECHSITVYEFQMGDVDDPDLYAAQPMLEWEKSDKGQWIMRNSADTPTWHRIADPVTFGYRYIIRAKLMGSALTEWLLKYGDK